MKKKHITLIINIIGIILIIIPLFLYGVKDIPLSQGYNKWLFVGSMLAFIVGQSYKGLQIYKRDGNIEKSCIGNIIAFLIVIFLIFFNY